jgi:hypothetical protein
MPSGDDVGNAPDAERWRRVEALLDEALELEASDVAAFLERRRIVGLNVRTDGLQKKPG